MASRIPKMEVTIDNVRFKEVPDKRQGTKITTILTLSNVKMSESVADYINNPDDRFYTLVNAVDIDWNAVVIDENLELHTTSDLIKWIKSIASGGIDPSHYYDKDAIDLLLEDKVDTSALSEVATSGSYNDLKDKPLIPTKVSDLTNDAEYLVASDISGKANTADLATVATTGSYNDLTHKPTIPDAQVQSNWNESDTTKASYIKNKPSLAAVATTGSYRDLSDKPIIPNEQIQSNWSQTDTSAKDYIKNKPTIPTKTSQLTNDSSFITSADIPEGAAASNTTPKEDGVANVGSELAFARGDHRHPHDSTKADISSLASVATSGNYNDLENKPTIPDAQIQSDWNQTITTAKDFIKNKPTLATVATSGSFNDLTNKPSYTKSDVGLNNVLNVEQIPATEKGTANGVATLGSDGKILSSQLPSYVDDVIEADSQSAFPLTGEAGKIYVAKDTNKTYRWSGSTYVEISESLALGETSSTAFAGDRGKAIEQKLLGIENGAEVNVLSDWTESDDTKDSYIKNKPTIPTKTSQLTNDSNFVTSSDIPQVPTDVLKYTELNLTEEQKAQARSNIGAGASGFSGDYNDLTNKPDLKTVATSGSYNDLLNKPAIPDAQILSDWNQTVSTSKDYIKNKPTIPTKTSQLTNDSSFITSSDIPEGAAASNTTPKEATNGGNKGTETAFARGDHSHPHDSSKLDVINSNSKLDASLIDDTNSTNKFVTTSEKTTWNNKQNAINDLQDIRTGASAGATAVQPGDLSTVATSGNYDDLTNKPTIPAAQVQSDWNETSNASKAFIKNKPTIPVVPTTVSSFTNDVGYLTSQDISGKADSADLATVATSGDYNDLENKPTIPDALIQSNWTQTNSAAKDYIKNKPTIPTKTSLLTNDSSFITTADIPEGAAASTTTPLEDGEASHGEEMAFARGDHRHPHDTSKQDVIDGNNKLSSDLVDDTNKTHKFVTASEKQTWSNKQNTISDLQTIREGAAAGATAIQASDLATVATTGNYADLNGKPLIPAAQILSDWNLTTTTAKDYIKNKPELATVATSGSYNDLADTPSLGTAAYKDLITTVTLNSERPITSGAVYSELQGKQATINSSNKISADLVDDSSSDNKFVTASQKTTWSNKQDAINDLADIRSGATAGSTALQPEDIQGWAKQPTKPSYTANEVGAIPSSEKGANNGVATLDSTGKVPSSLLPSYVDDVLEYNSQSAFPVTGESGKIYIAKDTNKTYRWSGSAYVEISASLALGETSSTAFAGNRGKVIEDKVGNIESGAQKNVQADWTETDTTSDAYIKHKPTIPEGAEASSTTPKMDGTASVGEETKFARGDHQHPSDTTKANKSEMSITAGTGANADKTTIQLKTGMSATVLTLHQDISGKVDAVSGKGLSTNDYTTTEKNKLAGIEAGAQVHKAPTKTEVTAALGYTPPQTNTTYQFEQDGNSLKMGTDGGNKTSIYTPSFNAPVTSVADKTGDVTLTKSDVGLDNVGNFKAVSTVANQGLNSTEKAAARANIGAGTSNFSGNYNDLTDKPTIPTDTNQKVKAGSVTFGNNDVVEIAAGSNVTVTGNSSNKKITIAATDTTYESKAAASGGTAVSLVTTGEKYNWNNKLSANEDAHLKSLTTITPQTLQAFFDQALSEKKNIDLDGMTITLSSKIALKNTFIHNDMWWWTIKNGTIICDATGSDKVLFTSGTSTWSTNDPQFGCIVFDNVNFINSSTVANLDTVDSFCEYRNIYNDWIKVWNDDAALPMSSRTRYKYQDPVGEYQPLATQTFVLDRSKLCRVQFNYCSFNGISLAKADRSATYGTSDWAMREYMQSIYITGCRIWNLEYKFIEAFQGYDIHLTNNTIEFSLESVIMDVTVPDMIEISGNLVQFVREVIRFRDGLTVSITNNYFEGCIEHVVEQYGESATQGFTFTGNVCFPLTFDIVPDEGVGTYYSLYFNGAMKGYTILSNAFWKNTDTSSRPPYTVKPAYFAHWWDSDGVFLASDKDETVGVGYNGSMSAPTVMKITTGNPSESCLDYGWNGIIAPVGGKSSDMGISGSYDYHIPAPGGVHRISLDKSRVEYDFTLNNQTLRLSDYIWKATMADAAASYVPWTYVKRQLAEDGYAIEKGDLNPSVPADLAKFQSPWFKQCLVMDGQTGSDYLDDNLGQPASRMDFTKNGEYYNDLMRYDPSTGSEWWRDNCWRDSRGFRATLPDHGTTAERPFSVTKITSFTNSGYIINGSTNIWEQGSAYWDTTLIDISSYSDRFMQIDSPMASIAILKEAPVANQQVQYATGWSGYSVTYPNVRVLIPSDAKYLVIITVSDGATTTINNVAITTEFIPFRHKAGFQYFDTDLGKTIWFSGNVYKGDNGWVDATGNDPRETIVQTIYKFPVNSYSLDYTSKIWVENSFYPGCLINVEFHQEEYCRFTGGSAGMTFLKSEPVLELPADYATGYGTNGYDSAEGTVLVPADAKYLWILSLDRKVDKIEFLL